MLLFSLPCFVALSFFAGEMVIHRVMDRELRVFREDELCLFQYHHHRSVVIITHLLCYCVGVCDDKNNNEQELHFHKLNVRDRYRTRTMLRLSKRLGVNGGGRREINSDNFLH